MAVLKGEGIYPILFVTKTIPVGARTHTAYMALPDQVGRWPAVLVFGGARGLTPPIRDLCRRLARHGFAAVAPDLYDGTRVPADRETAVAAFAELAHAAVDRVAANVGSFVLATPGAWDVSSGIGVVATQAGTRAGLAAAAAFDSPAVLVAPELAEADDGADTRLLGELTEPLLGLVGREDELTSLEDVTAARSAAPHSQWVLYDGLGHDFFDDNEDGYDAFGFADAFDRIVEFLTKNLQPAS